MLPVTDKGSTKGYLQSVKFLFPRLFGSRIAKKARVSALEGAETRVLGVQQEGGYLGLAACCAWTDCGKARRKLVR